MIPFKSLDFIFGKSIKEIKSLASLSRKNILEKV
jgi:hypothetical protein